MDSFTLRTLIGGMVFETLLFLDLTLIGCVLYMVCSDWLHVFWSLYAQIGCVLLGSSFDWLLVQACSDWPYFVQVLAVKFYDRRLNILVTCGKVDNRVIAVMCDSDKSTYVAHCHCRYVYSICDIGRPMKDKDSVIVDKPQWQNCGHWWASWEFL